RCQRRTSGWGRITNTSPDLTVVYIPFLQSVTSLVLCDFVSQRGLSAIDRFSGSAAPFLFPPFCPNRGGRLRSEGASGGHGSFSPGSSLLRRPVPSAPGTAL